jgi:hypothetical protein
MPTAAENLLEAMRRSKSNWKRRDLEALYEGFGFEIRHGANHDIFVHRVYKHLRATLPRHNDVLKTYVSMAVKLVDRVLELDQSHLGGDNA